MKFPVFLFLLLPSYALSQESFSLFSQNPLTVNPAFAGSSNSLRLCSGYRNYWPEVFGDEISYTFSADYYLAALRSGIGLRYFSDGPAASYGPYRNDRAGLGWAFRIPLFKDADKRPIAILQPAVEYVYGIRRIDTAGMSCGWPCTPLTRTRVDYHDLSVGLLFYTRNFFLGASVNHLNDPDVAFSGNYKLPLAYTVHASGIIRFEDSKRDFFIEPRSLLSGQQDHSRIQMGVALHWNGVFLGADYRTNAALLFQLGVRMAGCTLAYLYESQRSYVYNASSAWYGSHEVSLQVRLFRGRQDQSLTTNDYF
ncbi:MAG: PorP/SprF family type IX secretion system membrane protein [Bacteroidota bacterium]